MVKPTRKMASLMFGTAQFIARIEVAVTLNPPSEKTEGGYKLIPEGVVHRTRHGRERRGIRLYEVCAATLESGRCNSSQGLAGESQNLDP